MRSRDPGRRRRAFAERLQQEGYDRLDGHRLDWLQHHQPVHQRHGLDWLDQFRLGRWRDELYPQCNHHHDHYALMLGRTCTWAAAAAVSLALAGCDRGATGNPNAPGSPGTGNPRETAAPGAPDTPPGGPSGVKGSLPHTGSSGGDAVPGTTGRGTAEEGGRSQPPQPGTGLQGGLGGSAASGASAPAGTPTGGSTNRTPGGATGQR